MSIIEIGEQQGRGTRKSAGNVVIDRHRRDTNRIDGQQDCSNRGFTNNVIQKNRTFLTGECSYGLLNPRNDAQPEAWPPRTLSREVPLARVDF
jgi:hypothetical protein